MEEIKIENPKIWFNRASICFEILVDETYYQPTIIRSSVGNAHYFFEERYCPFNHSFETDLLAYSYQKEPPFFTKNIAGPQQVTIKFPLVTEYTSEGRQVTLNARENDQAKCVECDKISYKQTKLNIFLNYTYFINSEIRVWHLIFTATDEFPINEYDIIKLVKFFSGSQESKSEADKTIQINKVKFELTEPAEEDTDKINVTEQTINISSLGMLFTQLSGIQYKSKNLSNSNELYHISSDNIHTGIIAIDTKFCSFTDYFSNKEKDDHQSKKNNYEAALEQLYKNLKNNEEGQKVSSVEVERHYQANKNAEMVFETFCGFTLGIFDFDRMSFEEVSDTLVPRSSTESSFLTINRGVLSSFGHNDNVFEAIHSTLGISPYLMIPSSVLAQNDFIANEAFSRSKKILENTRNKNSKINIQALESVRIEIKSLLNVDYLPNVFQYPTEQDLFNYGMHHRGIIEKINRTKANLEQIDDIINESNSQLNHRYQFWVNVLLMIISIFQIYEVVANLIIEIASPKLLLNLTLVKIVVLIFLIILCTYIAMRLYRKSAIDTDRKFILKE